MASLHDDANLEPNNKLQPHEQDEQGTTRARPPPPVRPRFGSSRFPCASVFAVGTLPHTDTERSRRTRDRRT